MSSQRIWKLAEQIFPFWSTCFCDVLSSFHCSNFAGPKSAVTCMKSCRSWISGEPNNFFSRCFFDLWSSNFGLSGFTSSWVLSWRKWLVTLKATDPTTRWGRAVSRWSGIDQLLKEVEDLKTDFRLGRSVTSWYRLMPKRFYSLVLPNSKKGAEIQSSYLINLYHIFKVWFIFFSLLDYDIILILYICFEAMWRMSLTTSTTPIGKAPLQSAPAAKNHGASC